MKKIRIGLLAAVMCAIPALASAQDEGEEGATPAAGGGEEETAAGTEEGAADGAAGGEEVPGEGAEIPGMGAEPAGDGLAAICQIDPDACPKLDMEKEAKKDLNEKIYAVQQIYAKRKMRFELNPYMGIGMNDQYVQHPGPGVAGNFYLLEVLAIGVNFNYYRPFKSESDFNADVRRAARVGVPLTQYDWNANFNITYVPSYGKFAGFSDFIFHWDLYVVAGGGAISTKPIAVIDPDNRKFGYEIKPTGNVGVGARVFFNRWFAAILEFRDYIFAEDLESLEVSEDPDIASDPDTWYDEDPEITNNVQLQFGVSIFLPFSFEYRLPK
ncbi:MAG: outer membrane beta-barrel domain-containing protein [Polyangiaceae bacterium]|nr:outer membrane beta-barrel domain-containing protein [Polyangiaceae bacterium]